jgi:hypothetical protein
MTKAHQVAMGAVVALAAMPAALVLRHCEEVKRERQMTAESGMVNLAKSLDVALSRGCTPPPRTFQDLLSCTGQSEDQRWYWRDGWHDDLLFAWTCTAGRRGYTIRSLGPNKIEGGVLTDDDLVMTGPAPESHLVVPSCDVEP